MMNVKIRVLQEEGSDLIFRSESHRKTQDGVTVFTERPPRMKEKNLKVRRVFNDEQLEQMRKYEDSLKSQNGE